jgi:hypothetical protein
MSACLFNPARRAVLVVAGVLAALLAIVACSDSSTNPNQPPLVPDGASEALFVRAGAGGDGDWRSPLGSIQAALDIATQDTTVKLIYVAAGEYHESLVVRSAIKVIGGRDPANQWLPTGADSSVVRGRIVSGRPVAVLVQNVTGEVTLQNLTIVAPDAKQAGQNSVAVYCINSERVQLKSNRIVGGTAGEGMAGSAGVAGEYGFGAATSDGYPATPGGAGGRGGTAAQPPEWGDRGVCADGSVSGGNGGAPGEDPQPGLAGADGAAGAYGAGGRAALQIDSSGSLPVIHVRDGGDGADGADGCGGGGGGGHAMCSADTPGGAGGHGGSGGQRGTGGYGGKAGGSSVGVVAYRTPVRLQDCVISLAAGGDGGDGGEGAPGGTGGAGFAGQAVPGCGGAPGGDGGAGGRGGHGGGGAGGWSVGVVVFGSDELEQDNAVYQLSMGGQGGRGPGAAGETGFSQRTAVIR